MAVTSAVAAATSAAGAGETGAAVGSRRRRSAAHVRRDAQAAVLVHAVAAGQLRLPASLPDDLPRPSGAGQGRTLGAQHRRRGRAPGAAPVVAAARSATHSRSGRRPGRAQLADTTASATTTSPQHGASARGTGSVATSTTSTPMTSRSGSSGRSRPDRPAGGQRPGRSHRRPRRRAGDRRLQDRPPRRPTRRRPRLAGARAVRDRRRAHAAPPLPSGSSCTICPPARWPRSSTPTSRWPATSTGPRRALTTSSPRPTRWPPARTPTRSSRPSPARAVRGATSARHCPEGRAASSDRSSWAGLAEAAEH